MAAAVHLYLQCLLGMRCNDFTIVAGDQTNLQSIIVMKDDEDKLYPVSDKIVLGLNGEVGDRTQFSQLVAKNLELYKMKNGYKLGTSAVTYFTRKNMIDALENGPPMYFGCYCDNLAWNYSSVLFSPVCDFQSPFILNVLVAGFDEEKGAQLYYLDLLATCIQVPFAVHGFGGLLSLSILSSYYRPADPNLSALDLTEVQAYEVLKLCVSEIHKRLYMNLPNFCVKTISKNGIKTLPVINPSSLTVN